MEVRLDVGMVLRFAASSGSWRVWRESSDRNLGGCVEWAPANLILDRVKAVAGFGIDPQLAIGNDKRS